VIYYKVLDYDAIFPLESESKTIESTVIDTKMVEDRKILL